MNKVDKSKLIDKILCELKSSAIVNNKYIDMSDTFFSLVFKTDKELVKIAKLCGI